MAKYKSLIAAWYLYKFRLPLDSYVTFPFRIDISEYNQTYNNCRAVIKAKDLSWKPRPVDLVSVQQALVRMSISATYYNVVTNKREAPDFVFYPKQESDFYFKYLWEEKHFKLLTITPAQEIFDEANEPAIVYNFGLKR